MVFSGTGNTLGVGFTVTLKFTERPSLQPACPTGVIVYKTYCGASVGLTRKSSMIWLSGSSVPDGVYPVMPPGDTAVNLKETSAFVKRLGLLSLMRVTLLSHNIVSVGTGKILGVGFTVTVTFTDRPSLHPTGLTGVILYTTS